MLAGFKKFIIQGNVVDLAVGVVIGAAFGTVVKAFTDGFLLPIIQRVSGGGVTGGKISIGEGQYLDWATFLNTLIAFVITAAAIYFLVVVPINTLKDRRKQSDEPEDPSNEEKMVELLQQIAAK